MSSIIADVAKVFSVANMLVPGAQGLSLTQIAKVLGTEGFNSFISNFLSLLGKAGAPSSLLQAFQQVAQQSTSQAKLSPDPASWNGALKQAGDQLKEMEGIVQQLLDGMRKIADAMRTGPSGSKKASGAAGGGSWLEAIAEAMGQVTGQLAGKMVDLSNQIAALGSGSDSQTAMQMTKLQAQLQAVSQLFSMLQNAFATVIKSIGEGGAVMAKKD